MASYPGAVKSFTTRNAGDVIQPSHMNDVQDEVNAIESGLLQGTAPLNSSHSTVASLSVSGGSTFTGIAETRSAQSITAGALTVNLALGTLFAVTLSSNMSTLTISNVPAAGSVGQFSLVITANGSSFTWTWPTTFKWAGGSAPTLSTGNNKKDVLSFITDDGGSTWLGFVGGQNF